MVDVIICTYNGEQRIKDTINSVLHNNHVCKVIIVDNNCTDNTVNICKNTISECIVVKQQMQGLCFAREAGYRLCDSDFVLFVDDDNILKDDYIDKMLANLYSDSKIGACIGVSNGEFISEPPIKHLAECFAIGIPSEHLWGSGLCIRRDILDLFYNNFNHILIDRTNSKSAVSSGSDTEIMCFLSLLGYKQKVATNTSLTHKISPNKCTIDYMSKLFYGFGEVRFVMDYFYGNGNIDYFNKIRTAQQVNNSARLRSFHKRCNSKQEEYLYNHLNRGFFDALNKYLLMFNKQKQELYDKFNSLHILDK